jgi:hypothetical protein
MDLSRRRHNVVVFSGRGKGDAFWLRRMRLIPMK